MKLRLDARDDERLLTAPFPFQQTYATARTDLSRFVETLLDPFEVTTASVWIETIVFTPKDLIWYLRGAGIFPSDDELNDSLLIAESKVEAATLLECLLGQWVDFAFFAAARELVIYADHDESTTVFTENAEKLNILRKSMRAAGFEQIQNWVWTRPRSPQKQDRDS